jgi:MazG family protein
MAPRVIKTRAKQKRRRPRPAGPAFAKLVRIMSTLRSPNGCPWDRKQTHQTLRPFLLEETYELLDALDRHDMKALPGEIGDLLFQCVFHAEIAAGAGRFDIVDSINAIADKLIRRHPHVFTRSGRPIGRGAQAKRKNAKTPAAVLTQWEAIKAGEQAGRGEKKRILAGVPRAMPALLRSHEISTRVAAVGFEWEKATDVIDKIDEEVRELREALAQEPHRAEEELGDLLFTISNLARKLGLEPESALRMANDKFTKRFNEVESRLERAGSSVHTADLDEMERAWAAVKAQSD